MSTNLKVTFALIAGFLLALGVLGAAATSGGTSGAAAADLSPQQSAELLVRADSHRLTSTNQPTDQPTDQPTEQATEQAGGEAAGAGVHGDQLTGGRARVEPAEPEVKVPRARGTT